MDTVPEDTGKEIAQKILSCVKRMKTRTSLGLVIHVLRGTSHPEVITHGFNELSTFGLMQNVSENQLRDYINTLVSLGCLTCVENQLQWTRLSVEVIRGKREVSIKKLPERISFERFLETRSIKETAESLQLSMSTIATHIERVMLQKEQIDLSLLVSTLKQQEIRQAIKEVGLDRVRPLREILPAEISYEDIRFVRAYQYVWKEQFSSAPAEQIKLF